ncbi:MAG: alkaline phosphatase family protein [Armatimonadota bacterium]|nr:alkaline phosphatase family protein [Armatimonadota bacterium]MDR7447729.1 alkaline phosphatase family protein [Armatimonadota bacterium]MDR7458504.1 alkaline phosphatase family protein [Armatimonadota bacterium]MDR7479937.1 alkaline phosphatase family protein [Armatimonadota bacterium]MDR7488153.1 alkaline phosphatase family protein [Armatimonadota bacterium]
MRRPSTPGPAGQPLVSRLLPARRPLGSWLLPVALLPAVLLAGLLAALPTSAQPAVRAAVARHVVVLSFDGLRPDALRAVWGPLAGQSAAAWSARTTLPSVTLPAHASMLTGVGPAGHGVRMNVWEEGPRLDRPTVFSEVLRHGRRAYAIVAKRKLLYLVPEAVPQEHLLYPRARQAQVVAHASRVLRERRPAFLFAHAADPDDVGHRDGWMSPPYLQVVAEVPGVVARFLDDLRRAGLWPVTLLIVTADHGGHGRGHGAGRPEDVLIPWIALGGPARAGTTLTDPIVTYDTAATALDALGLPVPSTWTGRPVRQAYAVPVR